MKTVIVFIVALVIGATLALVVRSAVHDPHAGHAEQADIGPSSALPAAVDPHAGHAPTPAVDPHAGHAPTPAVDPHAGHAPTPAVDPHAGHSATPASVPDSVAEPAPLTVNSICPICGMDVDPSLGIWHYQGKPIGIGCRACVNKIEHEIERYGPAALENRRLR